MTDLTLTNDQVRAVEAVQSWFKHSSEQVFELAGFAGCGKTFATKYLIHTLGLDPSEDVRFCAFTGQAARRLRQELHDERTLSSMPEMRTADVSTIHRLIYQPIMKARDKLHELIAARQNATTEAEKADLDRKIAEEEKVISQPGFTLNPDSDLRNARLCVVDEASMVSEKMARDLMSFGVKILVLGDPAQLPPVNGSSYFLKDEPDVLLTEPKRFGGMSSVLEVATAVRSGERVDSLLKGSDGGPPSGRWPRPVTIEQAMRFDIVLCYKNDTRWRLTRLLRHANGHSEPIPSGGEKIMMLANNYDLAVFNGQTLRVEEVTVEDGNSEVFQINGVDDDDHGTPYSLPVLAGGFQGMKQQTAAERQARGRFKIGSGTGVATFAYASTVHKFQGSGAGKVLVIDEEPVVRYVRGDDEARKWAYTAVTRAESQVIIAPDIAG